MDEQYIPVFVHADGGYAPDFVLLLPDIGPFAGNHADALDKARILLFIAVEIVAILVENFYFRQGAVCGIKGKYGLILGGPRIIHMAFRFHQGNTGQTVGLIHAGVDRGGQPVF